MLQRFINMITGPINQQVAELKKQTELLDVKRKNLDARLKELDKREQELTQRELELAKREPLFSESVLNSKVTRIATKMAEQITTEYQTRLTQLQQREAELARSNITYRQQLIQEWDRLLQAKQNGVVKQGQGQETFTGCEQGAEFPEWQQQ